MHCKNCNAKIDKKDSYCKNCGTKIDKVKSSGTPFAVGIIICIVLDIFLFPRVLGFIFSFFVKEFSDSSALFAALFGSAGAFIGAAIFLGLIDIIIFDFVVAIAVSSTKK